VTLVIFISALIALIDPLPSILQFDREHPWQLWRWITCHLTHWSGDHLFWDQLVFVALAAVCERLDRRRFAWALAISAPAISLAVATCQPQLQSYRGLSGIDSALFGLLCGQLLTTRQRTLRMIIAATALLFVTKLVIEILTDGAVFVDSGRAGFAPVPLAHAVGAVSGFVCAIFPRLCLKTVV
jgi:rhomboid family GlyGly-CTERM serine protease